MTDTSSQSTPHGEKLQAQGSQLAGSLAALAGWAVVFVPFLLLTLMILTAVLEPSRSIADIRNIAIMIGGALLLFCMIAAPHLLGQAVRFKERAMWRAAIITGIPAACVIVYFVFRFLSNLG